MNNVLGILSKRKPGLFNKVIQIFCNKKCVWNDEIKPSNLDKHNLVLLCDMLIKSPTHNIIRHRRQKKLDYYHVDHAYFWRGYSHVTGNKNPFKCEWFRISKNSHALNQILDVDDSRWKKYFYDYFGGYGKEYSKRGSKILFCPPSSHVLSLYDQKDWTEDTLQQLRKNTDREIVIRSKPNDNSKDNISLSTNLTLEEDLEDCWAIVTHSSCAAITAHLMGVPSFSDLNSPTAPVSLSDYSKIENPFYPDDIHKMNWLNSLAYSQYTISEFKSDTYSWIFNSIRKSIE